MRTKTPKLPDPEAIRHAIDPLKARIADLHALFPLAVVQLLRKSLHDHNLTKTPTKAVR